MSGNNMISIQISSLSRFEITEWNVNEMEGI